MAAFLAVGGIIAMLLMRVNSTAVIILFLFGVSFNLMLKRGFV